MKVKDFLTKENWIKGAMALTADGFDCATSDPEAARFCLLGALKKCYQSSDYDESRDKLYSAVVTYSKGGNRGVAGFNDAENTTFEDIKKVLELADI